MLGVYLVSTFIFDPANLYYELPWLDIPMHFIGGFCVTLFVLAVASHGHQKLSLTQVFMVYLMVAITWELYEVFRDLLVRHTEWNGWQDTLADVFNGAVGTWVAFSLRK